MEIKSSAEGKGEKRYGEQGDCLRHLLWRMPVDLSTGVRPQLSLEPRVSGGATQQARLMSSQPQLQGQTGKQVQASLPFCQAGAAKEQWDTGMWGEHRGAHQVKARMPRKLE